MEDGSVQRAKPLTLSDISEQLSADTGIDVDYCKQKLTELLEWAEVLNEEASKKENRKSFR